MGQLKTAKASNTGKAMCLEKDGSSNEPGTRVVAWDCKQDSLADTWIWHETGEIIHKATNLCLDAKGYDANSGRLEVYSCDSHVD